MALSDSDPKVLPRPIPETTKSGNGDLVEIGLDDLVPREKRRLGDYLAYQTQEVHKNEYAIKPGSVPFSIKTDTGNPAPITDVDTNAVKTYLGNFPGPESAEFQNLSDSGMLDTDTKFNIKKGKSDDDFKTGTDYFTEISEKLGEAEVPQRVDQALLSNNRFNEKNPAFVSGEQEGVGNSIGSLIIQPTLGEHSPRKFPKKTSDGGDVTFIPIAKLKNIGMITLLNASGEINVPNDLEDPIAALGAAATAINVPGLARIGQRVPVSRFDTVKILNEANPDFKKEIRDKNLAGGDILSYGNVNNPLVPFNGLLAVSSINSAALLSVTISTIIKALYTSVNAINEARVQSGRSSIVGGTRSPSTDRKLRLGSYFGKEDSSQIFRQYRSNIGLNLVTTKYGYFECVNKGIDVFFGNSGSGSGGIGLGPNALASVAQSHGYYNVILRSLVKNTSDLILAFAKPSGAVSNTSYDVDHALGGSTSGGLDTAVTAVAYTDLLNASPLLKFMNILAMIGEVDFASEDIGFSGTIDGIADTGQDSDGNVIPKLGVLQAKNRLSDTFGGRMAWGSNTVKSMYLLPDEIKTSARRYDGDDSRFSSYTGKKGFKNASGGRFAPDVVEKFEDYLEADYMPFYFHDLRTNEIISFHAFLENVSDTFDVNYTENDGYGRVDQVLTYKNTNRNINLGFSVVSTNPEDFDDMWYKINKLLTLLYPQYTQGRVLQFGGDSFVQPFSQLPGASPLIRLRLGDIFKSNYNKFDLARIFGISSSDFFLEAEGDRTERTERDTSRFEEAKTRIINRMEEGLWQAGDFATLRANWTPPSGHARPPAHTLFERVPTGTAGGSASTAAARARLADLSISSPKRVRIIANDTVFPRTGGEGLGVEVRLTDPVGSAEEGTFVVAQIGDLGIIPEEVDRQALEQVGDSPTDAEASEREQSRQAIEQFFNPGGDSPNPVFKSFESVRGRGLAGFIKNFSMDIAQNVPWETIGINNRAPKLVKISMQFKPIHDLAPGLDHNGYNTAPLYNVGKLLKNSTRNGTQAELTAREQQYSTDTNISVTSGDGTTRRS